MFGGTGRFKVGLEGKGQQFNYCCNYRKELHRIIEVQCKIMYVYKNALYQIINFNVST